MFMSRALWWSWGGWRFEASSVRETAAICSGGVLNFRATTLHKCEVSPRRARVQGSKTLASLNSRLESKKKKKKRSSSGRTGYNNRLRTLEGCTEYIVRIQGGNANRSHYLLSKGLELRVIIGYSYGSLVKIRAARLRALMGRIRFLSASKEPYILTKIRDYGSLLKVARSLTWLQLQKASPLRASLQAPHPTTANQTPTFRLLATTDESLITLAHNSRKPT